MTVNLLAENKLKITLDASELRALFGDYRKIDYADPATRCALGALLRQAAGDADFALDCEQVRIEVYPTAVGGCAIYFTKSDAPLRKKAKLRRGGRPRFYLLECADGADLLETVAALYDDPLLRSVPSRLYRMERGYRLAVAATPAVNAALPHLREYCDRVLRANVDLAYTEEYGSRLTDGCVVREIGRYLTRGKGRRKPSDPGA